MTRKRRGPTSESRSKDSDAQAKAAATDTDVTADKAAKADQGASSEDATVVVADATASAVEDTVAVTADQVAAAATEADSDVPTLKPTSKYQPKDVAAAKEAEFEEQLFDQVTLAPQRRPTAQAMTQPAPFSATPPRETTADKSTTGKGKADKGKANKATAKKEQLGVDVAILWRGDMLTARFFPKPARVSVGPNGTFTMPEDVVGGAERVLVEPHGASRFGLRIDNDKAAGHLIVDGDVYDLSEVRQGNVSSLKGPVIPLTAGTRAVLVFGDFTFIVSRVPVPPPRKFMLWSRDMLPFLVCLLFSVALTIGPLTIAHSFADLRGRAQLSYKEKLDKRLAVLEFIEIKEEEKPPEEEEKKEEEKKEEPPVLTPQEKEKIEEKEIVKKESELEQELKNLDDDKKDERIKALVDEAAKETGAIDDALAALDSQVGTRLFAEVDGEAGDSTVNPNGAGGADVLADPEGLTAGKALAAPTGGSDTVGGKAATQKAKIDGLGKDKKIQAVDIAIKKKGQRLVRVGGGRGSRAHGELPKKVIKRYIATKMGAIKACYQKGLQANPGLQGKVKVMFLIQPNGAVAGAKISDSGLNSPAVESCILRNIKVWRFPRAKGGGSTKVIYPFNFRNR